MKELKLLTFDEFKKVWIKKARSLGKKKNVKINAEFWLLNVQNFLEFFFLDHLNINIELAMEFGFIESLEKAGSRVNSEELSTTLIFCSANSALDLSDALKVDAYNYALELYKNNSIEEKEMIQEVVSRYKNNYLIYAQKIIDNIEDWVLVKRMETIRNTFELREKDYKYIKNNLTIEFDSSLVFDFNQLYNTEKVKGAI